MLEDINWVLEDILSARIYIEGWNIYWVLEDIYWVLEDIHWVL